MINHPCVNFNTTNQSISTVKTKNSTTNLNHFIQNKYKFPKKSNNPHEPSLYIALTGNKNKARVLNQLIFWSNKSTKYLDGWFYKPYEVWQKETGVSERTLRNIFKEFETKGWIQTKVKKIYGKNIKHFKVSIEQIVSSIESELNIKSLHVERVEDESKNQICRFEKAFLPVPYTDNNKQIKDNNVYIRSKNIDRGNEPDSDLPKPPNVVDIQQPQSKNSKYKSDKPDYCYKYENNNHEVINKNTDWYVPYAEEIKQELLQNKTCRELFEKQLGEYQITYEEIVEQCYQYYYETQREVINISRLTRWIRTQCPKRNNYKKKPTEMKPEIKLNQLINARINELKWPGLICMDERDRQKANNILISNPSILKKHFPKNHQEILEKLLSTTLSTENGDK